MSRQMLVLMLLFFFLAWDCKQPREDRVQFSSLALLGPGTHLSHSWHKKSRRGNVAMTSPVCQLADRGRS